MYRCVLRKYTRTSGIRSTLRRINARLYSEGKQKLTFSHVKGDTQVPLLTDTIGKFFDKQCETYEDKEAVVVVHQGVRLTYGQLKDKVDAFARGLLQLGFKKGERIGVWMPNTIEWMIAQYATAKIGAILVNINPAYRAHELQHALNLVGCKAIILTHHLKASDYFRLIRELCPEIDSKSSASGELKCERVPSLKYVIHNTTEDISGMIRFDDLLIDDQPDLDSLLSRIEKKLTHEDAVNIQFTSGTTGLPKGATLTHSNILNNGFFTGECMRLTPNDTLCIPVPLYHCFGLVLGNLAAFTHGTKVVYPSAGFDAEATLKAVHDEKCTALHGVPAMFIAELNHPNFKNYDLSSLRTGIMAGSPCPMEIMKKVMNDMHLKEMTIAYGMTETSPVSFQTRVDDPINVRIETVGSIHPHIECKVVDENGETVPVNTAGELYTRGYSVMQGYWNDEEKTSEAITSDGFMKTGDIAIIDEDGYCRITGRSKDVIIRGGENIYPREIEEFLYKHPKIRDVSVVGVPDKRVGEQVCAWVIPKEGVELTAEEIRDFCHEKIAHYKIPHYVLFVESFPMTITGKVQKYLMRQQSVDMLGLSKKDLADEPTATWSDPNATQQQQQAQAGHSK